MKVFLKDFLNETQEIDRRASLECTINPPVEMKCLQRQIARILQFHFVFFKVDSKHVLFIWLLKQGKC